MLTASRPQRTIARESSLSGISFLSGLDVRMTFRPAETGRGIVFVRSDLPGSPSVRAHVSKVIPRQRRTTVQDGPAVVEMVEHVMAALSGLRIDNCLVEIDGPETPGCDGSSQAFVEALIQAGSAEQDRPRSTFVIDRPITVREGEAVLTAHPGAGDTLVLSYNLDYGRNSPIVSQSRFIEVSPETFRADLAPSRTFLLQAEADTLRDAGVGTRTTYADLLIFGPDGVVGNTLRYHDECVRHKILDMVGDLAMLGVDLAGHVVAHRSGHSLNAKLVRKLLASVERPGQSTLIEGGPRDFAAIRRILPHRYPFLLVDRVLEMTPGRRVVAIKNVSCNEPFFQGHWPDRPIMPGVLIVEALAQAAGLMIAEKIDPTGLMAMIASIDGVKLRRPVVPGDQLRLEVDAIRLKERSASVKGVARVDGQLAAEAKIKFVMVEADRAA